MMLNLEPGPRATRQNYGLYHNSMLSMKLDGGFKHIASIENDDEQTFLACKTLETIITCSQRPEN